MSTSSPVLDAASGLPTFYGDATGLRLQPCFQGPPLCVGTLADWLNPPNEGFYWLANATLPTPHGGALLIQTVQAVTVPAPGPNVINRLRFRIGIPQTVTLPATYTLTYPYGSKTITVNAFGAAGRDINDTTDSGAFNATTAAQFAPVAQPCPAAGCPNLGPGSYTEPFLTLAPGEPAPPAGFIGDGGLHKVTGSPTGNNIFRIEGPGINPGATTVSCPGFTGAATDCMQTDLFTLQGQLADNIAVAPRPATFASQAVNTTSAATNVTVTNTSGTTANLGGLTLTGTNPGDFALTANACSNQALGAGASCTVGVTFTPTANGARSALISIPQGGGGTTITSGVNGTAFTPAPLVTLSANALDLGSSTVGQAAATKTVSIANTGTAALSVTSVSVPAGDFSVASQTCTAGSVAPGSTCSVVVGFTPSVAGARAAALSIVDNAGGSPRSVALTGSGVAPAAGGGTTAQGAGGSTDGYRLLGGDGGIFTFGDAGFFGSTGGQRLNAPIVGMTSTPSRRGYWQVARDGGVFAFGDAAYLGSMGGLHLNAPIIGMAATPSGRGYWLHAADGGIFTFGDAAFFGSTGSRRLNAPIIGMATTPSGRGYWLHAADGGIFTFGDAAFFGSMGGTRLTSPVVAMVSSATGRGYWMVGRDGSIYAFGDAGNFGSMGGLHLNSPVVGMAATRSGQGYWMVARDGGIFAFGDAGYFGSMGGSHLNSPIVGMS